MQVSCGRFVAAALLAVAFPPEQANAIKIAERETFSKKYFGRKQKNVLKNMSSYLPLSVDNQKLADEMKPERWNKKWARVEEERKKQGAKPTYDFMEAFTDGMRRSKNLFSKDQIKQVFKKAMPQAAKIVNHKCVQKEWFLETNEFRRAVEQYVSHKPSKMEEEAMMEVWRDVDKHSEELARWADDHESKNKPIERCPFTGTDYDLLALGSNEMAKVVSSLKLWVHNTGAVGAFYLSAKDWKMQTAEAISNADFFSKFSKDFYIFDQEHFEFRKSALFQTVLALLEDSPEVISGAFGKDEGSVQMTKLFRWVGLGMWDLQPGRDKYGDGVLVKADIQPLQPLERDFLKQVADAVGDKAHGKVEDVANALVNAKKPSRDGLSHSPHEMYPEPSTGQQPPNKYKMFVKHKLSDFAAFLRSKSE